MNKIVKYAVSLMLLSSSMGAYAATRNVVPRANGEGGIGTSSKNWASGYFQDVNVSDDLAVTDDASVSGALSVTETVTASSSVYMGAAGSVSTLTYAGALTIPGALSAASASLGTALSVGNGGTGATTLTDGGLLLGSGTGAITPLGVATNGQIPIGDGTTDPVLATITGTSDQVTVTNGAGSITLSLPVSFTMPYSSPTFDTVSITNPLGVASGGSGAATLTDGGILLGSGTGAITALGVGTNGQIPIGDGTTDPVLATITGTADQVTVTNGAGSITLSIPDSFTLPASSPTFSQVSGDGSGLTALVAANISAGSLGAGVIASSLAAGVPFPAEDVAAGSLGASVIASSVAVGVIDSDQIVNGAIDDGHLAGSITSSKIAAGNLGATVAASYMQLKAKADILAIDPPDTGRAFYGCSDCSATSFCVSTGTAVNDWASGINVAAVCE